MAKKVKKGIKEGTTEMSIIPVPEKLSIINKGNFVLKNNLLTIRFWSNAYTTSLFDKNISNYTLVCQYPLTNFNLDILKDFSAAQLYLDINDKIYVSRVGAFIANVSPESIVMQLTLANLRLKSAWDLEFNTPSVIYEKILTEKSFFRIAGKKLEDYVKPLGLIRKLSETDQALRRRTLEYLNYKMGDQAEVLTDAELRKLRGESNG